MKYIKHFEKVDFIFYSNKELTELPKLPDSLKTLYCNDNYLPYGNLDKYKEWYFNSITNKFNL